MCSRRPYDYKNSHLAKFENNDNGERCTQPGICFPSHGKHPGSNPYFKKTATFYLKHIITTRSPPLWWKSGRTTSCDCYSDRPVDYNGRNPLTVKTHTESQTMHIFYGNACLIPLLNISYHQITMTIYIRFLYHLLPVLCSVRTSNKKSTKPCYKNCLHYPRTNIHNPRALVSPERVGTVMSLQPIKPALLTYNTRLVISRNCMYYL